MPKRKKIDLDEISEGNKEILFDLFEREGVEAVTVGFDGGGDDGQIEESDLPDKIADIIVEGSRIPGGTFWSGSVAEARWKTNCSVREIIDSICYYALETLYEGWENNDGAFGEFLFDVKKRTILFDFNERYVESKLYEHVL